MTTTTDRDEVEVAGEDAEGSAEEPHARDLERRRRPTGEPPPLPRRQRMRAYRWTVVAAIAVAASVLVFWYRESGWIVVADEAVSRWLVEHRTPALVAAAGSLDALTGEWATRVPRWATVAVLATVRRFRVLAVFVASILLAEWLAFGLDSFIQRPRPMVEILGQWSGFSHPSQPIVALAVTLLGAIRALVPDGPWRRGATWGAGVVVAMVGLARVLLGLDHVSDVVVAAAIAAGVVFTATRLLVPNDRYPVRYRRGEGAHLEIDEARDDAIRRAVRNQLALDVVDVELFSPQGSAGSTPLRLRLRGPGPDAVFAKLLTRQHLRSDRAYKFGRFLLYGRLEDEHPFSSVRRLVEYEDHMARVLDDAGVPVPRSLGLVEITPEREYLIVFEMLPGDDLDPDEPLADEVLDNALLLVRQLWDAGIAHRDVKPGNLLVHDGRVWLVDMAFAQYRPSPWRQAVDLGAMLLLLALAGDPERVVERARRHFDDDELAEALAATSGFAIPGQLRALLAERDDDLLEHLRSLVPAREPIRVHRWSLRRVLLTSAVAAAAAAGLFVLWASLTTVGML